MMLHAVVVLTGSLIFRRSNGVAAHQQQQPPQLERRLGQVRDLNSYEDMQLKLVGGTDLKEPLYPWFAVTAGGILCGSSLVHGDIVISAAHRPGPLATSSSPESSLVNPSSFHVITTGIIARRGIGTDYDYGDHQNNSCSSTVAFESIQQQQCCGRHPRRARYVKRWIGKDVPVLVHCCWYNRFHRNSVLVALFRITRADANRNRKIIPTSSILLFFEL